MEEIEDKRSLVDIQDDEIAGLVEHMDEDFKKNFYLTDRELIRLKESLKKNILTDGSTSPLVCLAEDCALRKRCPLMDLDKAPVGDLCPIELYLVNKWKDEYIKSMEVDWSDRVDRMQVVSLIEIDLINNRANSMLAEKGLTMEQTIGTDEITGKEMTQTVVNLALEIKEKMSNRRSKVLKEMIATREAKSKFMKDIGYTPDEYAANLRERAKKLEEQHENESRKIESGEIIDVEE